MDDVVFMQEGHGAGQLLHEAPVGLWVGPSGQDVLVQVAAFAELHYEPEVARFLGVTGNTFTWEQRKKVLNNGTY